jgi:preprotein translocase subunit SecF
MEFFKPGTVIDFMRYRRILIPLSLVLCVASAASVFWPGPNYGTDFKGGTEIEVRFRGNVSPEQLRTALREIGRGDAEVVSVVSQRNQYIIRIGEFSAVDARQADRMVAAVTGAVGEDNLGPQGIRVSDGGDTVQMDFESEVDPETVKTALEGTGVSVLRVVPHGQSGEHMYEAQLRGISDELLAGLQRELGDRGPQDPERIERVGPRAGEQLRTAAIMSLLYTLALIMVYVAFRFDLRFAPGAMVALVHDALITVGVYVLLQREFNLTIVAAVLTIVGFSINDTIVVYDRIRENLGRHRDKSLYDVINISTSQMLSRTIITSGTALMSISAFFIWGTPVIRDLTLALFIGFAVGVYSSIYIAAPLTEWMDRRFFTKSKERAKHVRAQQRREA